MFLTMSIFVVLFVCLYEVLGGGMGMGQERTHKILVRTQLQKQIQEFLFITFPNIAK